MRLKPFKRCLWFQAEVVVHAAKKKGWIPAEEEVEDFYTPDFAAGSHEKVAAYLNSLP